MATLEPQVAVPRGSVEPTAVQPGGGFVVNLERAWARLRRRWLHRLRPGHARRLAERRQGDCPGCTHDVADPYDLKFHRNVCGYTFPREDDPYYRRRRLPFAPAGRAELVLSSLLLAVLGGLAAAAAVWVHGVFWLPFAAAVLLWAEVIYFFRDPERTIPTDADALLSPADGTVTRVDEVDEPDFPGGRALRVSIFLSIFNVHVNRVPRSGRVVRVRYFPGRFFDARREECGEQNEQLWLDLEERDPPRLVRVKQIAGALARRIVCWVRLGEEVRAGERYGMIKFGSRTDVLIPAGDAAEVLVKVGDRVCGGRSILLRVKSPVAS